MSKVTVLVPTYNRAKYISECIDSLLLQTVSAHQIIVIDDGSNDDTNKILQNYSSEIVFLKKANGGKSSAINFAMKYVTGDYIWIFDDDDVALPNSIEIRLKIFHERPDLGFVFSSHYYGQDSINGKIQRGTRYNLKTCPDSEVLHRLLMGYFFTLQSVLAKSECYRIAGLFNEELLRSQDYEMMIRLARRFHCTGINEPTFIFRRHDGERGPSQHRHSSDLRNKVWLTYDQMIGLQIRHSFSLSDFVPDAIDQQKSNLNQREAILHRMSVMASKGLVEEMLDDVETAISIQDHEQPVFSLSQQERKICREAVCHTYFLMVFYDNKNAVLKRLKRISKTYIGYQVILSFARGFLWLSRFGEGGLILRISHLLTSARMVMLKFLNAIGR